MFVKAVRALVVVALSLGSVIFAQSPAPVIDKPVVHTGIISRGLIHPAGDVDMYFSIVENDSIILCNIKAYRKTRIIFVGATKLSLLIAEGQKIVVYGVEDSHNEYVIVDSLRIGKVTIPEKVITK
jgi:hypothetical protein